MSKWNPRITNRDRNSIKGAIRRAFSRSELHQEVLKEAMVTHSDPERPRVKSWALCNICKKPDAKSYMAVDHIDPVIPYNTTFEALGADATIDRIWCEKSNLQVVCPSCHDAKTLIEKQLKKEHVASLKPPKVKKSRAKSKST